MIASTGTTFYLLSQMNKTSSPKDYSSDHSFEGYACFLKAADDSRNADWKCKRFDDFRDATKFILQKENKMPFKFVRISSWVPKVFHRRILKHELALNVHMLFPDESI
jgi:hypothetical protein